MSWLSSLLKPITKAVSSVGPLASFIPGAGPWVAGLGALSSLSANQDAQRRADQALKYGQGLEGRATALYDKLLAEVQKADSEGQFDPERRIRAMEKDTANYESKDMGNLAGALRVAGYRGGDSEIGTRLDAVKLKYQKMRESMSDQIRTQTFNEKLAAYNSVNANLLQPGIQGSQFRYSANTSNQSNPSGLVAAIAPFLNKKDKTTPSAAPPVTSGKWNLPVQYGFKK